MTSVRNVPSRFGRVSYRIESHLDQGYIEAVIEPLARSIPDQLVMRLRHPDGSPVQSIAVQGAQSHRLDRERNCIRMQPGEDAITLRANY